MQFPAEVIVLILGMLGFMVSTASLVAAAVAADRSKRIPDIEKEVTQGFTKLEGSFTGLHSSLADLKSSLEGLETVMTDFMSELLVDEAPMQAMFRSIDGRFEASTLEELMEKMMSDPNGPKMTQEDIDKLKEFFEQATDETDFEVDDDDDEESEEGWKKGK
jgi:uncharacterized phage infection (PIP) family protein YhgE